MFSERVAQKPTMAVSADRKYFVIGSPGGRFAGVARTSLSEIFGKAQRSRPTATISSNGAARASRCLIDSEPRITTARLATQKMKNPMTSPVPPSACQAGNMADSNRCTAIPPNRVCTPNQPQATIARISEGTLEPMMPNEARRTTGQGIPYRVPGNALRVRGISTMTLAIRMVHNASETDRPK